jgi:6-phosphogluconolactonase
MNSDKADIRTFADPTAAAQACGAAIFEILESACRERGTATLAVSGGSTPRLMFEWMATQDFDWSRTDLFWVDERCVPVDDERSNYRMTREALLNAIDPAPSRIHRIQGELTPDEAALLYRDDIARSFRLEPGELPVFDAVQRGMGPDGHTASLFPGEPLIANRTGIAAAVWVEKFKQHRVTLLPGVLERARQTLCLVSGQDKAEALHRVLRGPLDPLQVPSQIASKTMTWFVDTDAASAL